MFTVYRQDVYIGFTGCLALRTRNGRLTLYRPILHDVIRTVTAKLIQESTANQRKLGVRHSVAAKLAAETFMLSNIGRSSFLLKRLGVIVRLVSYKRT